MKVAVVIDNLNYGGAQSVCIDYINILLELGHTVEVYNLDPNKTQIENRLPKSVKVIHYSLPLNDCPSRFFIGVKAYRSGKYLFPFVYAGKSLILTIKRALFRVQYRCNYDLAIAFAGHYNDLTFVADNFVNAKKKLCWTHGALFQDFMASDGFLESYLKIKNIIVLNIMAQEEALAANHYMELEKKLNIHMLYNPIHMEDKPVDKDKVSKLKAEYKDFVIMVARFAYPHKDQYTVVSAMKILHEKYGMEKHVVFLGDGPEREKVEMYAEKIGMMKQCHFVGAHDDVQNYYSAAKMLVHSSVAFEGFALVLVEAMNFDLPVISTDTIVGPREVLGSGKYGLLCDVRDSESMADQIYKLFSDKALYQHFVKMGRERREDFTYEKIGTELKSILEGLI